MIDVLVYPITKHDDQIVWFFQHYWQNGAVAQLHCKSFTQVCGLCKNITMYPPTGCKNEKKSLIRVHPNGSGFFWLLLPSRRALLTHHLLRLHLDALVRVKVFEVVSTLDNLLDGGVVFFIFRRR